jgi:hypothetical protein
VVTLARSIIALLMMVIKPKRVEAVLISILMQILNLFKDNSIVHQLLNKKL